MPHFNAFAGGLSPVNNAIYKSLKLDSLAYTSAAESIGISLTNFT